MGGKGRGCTAAKELGREGKKKGEEGVTKERAKGRKRESGRMEEILTGERMRGKEWREKENEERERRERAKVEEI